MQQNVVRFSDYEKRSRNADAMPVRDPADTDVIIILPVIRIERTVESLPKTKRKPR